jgi:hypothetical protein
LTAFKKRPPASNGVTLKVTPLLISASRKSVTQKNLQKNWATDIGLFQKSLISSAKIFTPCPKVGRGIFHHYARNFSLPDR